jgi:hypothetical protein
MYVPQQQRKIMKNAMEMAVMESLRHPNVVRVYAVLTDMLELAGEAGREVAEVDRSRLCPSHQVRPCAPGILQPWLCLLLCLSWCLPVTWAPRGRDGACPRESCMVLLCLLRGLPAGGLVPAAGPSPTEAAAAAAAAAAGPLSPTDIRTASPSLLKYRPVQPEDDENVITCNIVVMEYCDRGG